ncbi:hypothetical protein, partial [uncultured Xanthomonas sp.]|uniref:hypothetical protein n=1 Tax=uncultured Xanthomonas sp. TaxID=152831 RepID=UPI0025F76A3E
MPVVAADPERVSAEGALRGVLSFGYFSLHKQRKVTRRKGESFASPVVVAAVGSLKATAKAFAWRR